MLESVVADIDLVILGHFPFYYVYLLNGNKLLAAKTCFIEYTVKSDLMIQTNWWCIHMHLVTNATNNKPAINGRMSMSHRK
jgi:hypothetical protein